MTKILNQEFDSEKYKITTHEQWQKAAKAWHDWGPTLATWLDPVTERMLDMAGLKEGMNVLDIAAGAGEQTLLAAKRVGPKGSVLATDISSNILSFAAEIARQAGFKNIQTKVMDGENLDVESGVYDVVMSRVGLIYFPDQQKALKGMLDALKPGGRIAAIVYSTADNNKFFSIPISIIRRRAKLPNPVPGQPGPFSLGSPGVLEGAFTRAGFKSVKCETVAAPLKMKNVAEYLRFAKESFGALHQMLSGLDQAGKDAAWAEIFEELEKFQTPDGFIGPCEIVIGVGVK